MSSSVTTAAPFHSLPVTSQWAILDALYGQARSLLGGVAAVVVVTGLAYGQCQQSWLLFWGVASILVLIWRITLVRAYWGRSADAKVGFWFRRFQYSAWITGLIWGVASIATLLDANGLAASAIINVQSGYAIAATLRNSAIPRIVMTQVFLILGPAILCCILSLSPVFMTYALLLLIYIGAAWAITQHLSAQTLSLLSSRESMAALVAEAEHANMELAAANNRLELLATIDGLTGISNRRRFDESLLRSWRHSMRNSSTLSLLLLDIDYFKSFNDTFGHLAGDECLRRIGHALSATARRPDDIVARYGGEEFSLILPEADEAQALVVAERIRSGVAELNLPHPNSPLGRISMSIGIATVRPRPDLTPEDLLGLADAALYAAKSSGPDLINVAPDMASLPLGELVGC